MSNINRKGKAYGWDDDEEKPKVVIKPKGAIKGAPKKEESKFESIKTEPVKPKEKKGDPEILMREAPGYLVRV